MEFFQLDRPQLRLNSLFQMNLDFIGLEFTEVLFGYRENQIEYSNFQNSSSVMRNKLKIKTIHYQFGVGFVF